MIYSLFGFKTPTAPVTHTNLDSYTHFRKQWSVYGSRCFRNFEHCIAADLERHPRARHRTARITCWESTGEISKETERRTASRNESPRRRKLKLAASSSAQLKERNRDDQAVSHKSSYKFHNLIFNDRM